MITRTEADKKEQEFIKEEFEKLFNKHNWVEALTDEEYIQEYTSQYQIFIDAYFLGKSV